MATKAKPARKPTKRKAPTPTPEPVIQVQLTPEQEQAKLFAYSTLKQAGATIPADLRLEVEAIVASAKQREKDEIQAAHAARSAEEKQIEADNSDGPTWVRNTYNAPFSVRLERQEKKRRIELKPRGQRGDMFPLQEGDSDDPNLIQNIEIGLIELIPNGVAKNIASKQTHNLQKEHVPMATLRNEKGEAYKPEAIKLEIEHNQQGVIVAVEDANVDKSNDDWAKGKTGAMGGLVRGDQVAQFVPTGDNPVTIANIGGNPAIISSGFDNAGAMRADEVARSIKGDAATGPSAAGILKVTVDPVQKEG